MRAFHTKLPFLRGLIKPVRLASTVVFRFMRGGAAEQADDLHRRPWASAASKGQGSASRGGEAEVVQKHLKLPRQHASNLTQHFQSLEATDSAGILPHPAQPGERS